MTRLWGGWPRRGGAGGEHQRQVFVGYSSSSSGTRRLVEHLRVIVRERCLLLMALALSAWLGALFTFFLVCNVPPLSNKLVQPQPQSQLQLQSPALEELRRRERARHTSGCSRLSLFHSNATTSRSPSSSSVLLFLHIQKVGGTSLWKALAQRLPNETRYSYKPFKNQQYWFPWELDTDRYRRLPTFDAVFGHFMFGIHNALDPQRGHCYLTLLRHPVDRLLSLWRFLASDYQHLLPLKKNPSSSSSSDSSSSAARIGAREFFDRSSSFQFQNKDNGMVRALCGPETHIVPFGGLTEDHLDCAKRHLELHFGVVMITEEFELSLQLLEKALGLPESQALPRLRENVTPRRESHALQETETETETKAEEASLRRLIEETNPLDMELYRFARETLFPRLLLEHGLHHKAQPSA